MQVDMWLLTGQARVTVKGRKVTLDIFRSCASWNPVQGTLGMTFCSTWRRV